VAIGPNAARELWHAARGLYAAGSRYIQAEDCRELLQHFGKRMVVSAAMRLTTDGSQ